MGDARVADESQQNGLVGGLDFGGEFVAAVARQDGRVTVAPVSDLDAVVVAIVARLLDAELIPEFQLDRVTLWSCSSPSVALRVVRLLIGVNWG